MSPSLTAVPFLWGGEDDIRVGHFLIAQRSVAGYFSTSKTEVGSELLLPVLMLLHHLQSTEWVSVISVQLRDLRHTTRTYEELAWREIHRLCSLPLSPLVFPCEERQNCTQTSS